MKPITQQLEAAFRRAISDAFGVEADPLIALSGNEKFGDYQSNAAMGLAKQLAQRGEKTNPRAVAERIKEKLDLGGMAAEVSIAGPGFINVKLSQEFVQGRLQEIAGEPRLGVERVERPQTVVVDYSGPNIAKQMHVGHLRSTIIGDAVARTLQFQGYNVIRQNHFGDWGTQFGRVVLAIWYKALFTRTGNQSALNDLVARMADAVKQKQVTQIAEVTRQAAAWHKKFIADDESGTKHFLPFLQESSLDLVELERLYQFASALTDNPTAEQVTISHTKWGEQTLADIARLSTTFVQALDKPGNEQEALAWKKARQITVDACNEIYSRLQVQLAMPNVQTEPIERGESFYNPLLSDVVSDLTAAGIAIESEGAIVVPVEGFESPLLIRKSPFIDERGRVLAEGGFLYGTTDLAAVRYRVQKLRASRILYFTDARQSQHFAQVFAVAKKAGWAEAVSMEHAPFGTMLGEDGKPIKTRSGGTVKLADLLDEAEERAFRLVTEKNPELSEEQRKQIAKAIGIGAVKYIDLSKDRTSNYIFSFEQMLSMEGNTAPYLQYAYARIRSIFRKGASSGVQLAGALVKLDTPHELALAKHILRLGEVVEVVARELKPHHLTTYLYELATRFSGFYENCPVLQSEEPVRSSRLLLSDLTARTLAQGLDLLGIAHPEQM